MYKVFAATMAVVMLAPMTPAAAAEPRNSLDPALVGHEVTYLGSIHTPYIYLQDDCTPGPSRPPRQPGDRCVVFSQTADTAFQENALRTLVLPPSASQTLLCFNVTPSILRNYENRSGATGFARFGAYPEITVENEVLDDPALIDPRTGLPFNGRFKRTLLTYSEIRALPSGHKDSTQFMLSQDCLSGDSTGTGAVTRQFLINLGLSPAQAAAFFAKATTIRLGVFGTGRMITDGHYRYSISVLGDRAPASGDEL
jgi:hypothetical protein